MKKQAQPTRSQQTFWQRHFRFHKPTRSGYFAIGAVGILLATTGYWAFLSAQVNLHNADQLVDEFLFEHNTTLHASVFPGAHSFMLKWPLFALIKLIGINQVTITVATVVLTLLTVGLLAFILHRIERRPVVFGALCLALASTLLLIPVEPYPGALLPVNMAMISTRNIEYILYVIALILIIRAPRLLHWKVLLATLSFGILIASDKLFLAFTVGGACLMLALSFLKPYRSERRFSLVWLVSGVASALLASFGLWLLGHFNFAIIGSSSQTGPYGLVHSVKDAVIGSIYALLGLFTNLGANPAFDATIIKQIPATAFHRLISIGGIAFIINIAVALFGIFAIGKVLRRKQQPKSTRTDTPQLLARSLIWTTVAAIVVFIVSDHYYPVDARYLAIVTFTVFVVLATYLRTVTFTARALKIGIGILVIGIIAGIIGATQQISRSDAFYAQMAVRDSTIAATLAQHPVTMLIGDYWRVMPVKLHDTNQAVIPLADCFTPRDILLSHAWQSDLATNSFAYIASFKPSVTGFPSCSIDEITAKYGRPNSTQLIAGTIAHPDEMLLFYDYGINSAANSTVLKRYTPSQSILPHPITDGLRSECMNGHNVMNVVAHQDDDLLFINPDTYHALKAGNCVRAVYVTAGDAGNSQLYWLSREEGSKAAYATMLGIANPVWITRTASISNTAYVTISFIRGNPQVTLIFMHLPDGNPSGKGFPTTHHESLLRLMQNSIPTINAVDNQSHYTSEELIAALTTLMTVYRPLEVHTQTMQNHSKKHPDHSDHLATGWYVNQAFTRYHQAQPDTAIQFYVGYPEQDRPVNVSGDDLAITEAAFFAYAQYDKGTCESVIACSKMSYGKYLNRQYKE